MVKAIFLDRDGTIIEDKHYINSPCQIRFKKGVVQGLKDLQNRGFWLFIITNQSGVKRGYHSRARSERINREIISRLLQEKIFIKDVEVCYHHPKERCRCRKPEPFMVFRILKKYPEIDLKNSWVIGDKTSDLQLAHNLGIRGIKVEQDEDFREVIKIILKAEGLYEDTTA